MDYFNLEPIDELVKELKNASHGHDFNQKAAVLSTEIQKRLIINLSTLQSKIGESTDKIVASNEKNSKSAENFAKSLSRATWVLAASTVALVVVTIISILK